MSAPDKYKDLVSWDIDANGIAVISMHDLEGQNALSEVFVKALLAGFLAVVDNPLSRVIVLTGTPDVFCSGAPKEVLKQLAQQELVPSDIELPRFLLNLPLPMIAAMEGHAIGGGLSLGICADIVMISRESRYGCSFMNMGISPGMGTTRLLEHAMLPAVAHELLFSGEFRRGSQFEDCGGFNYILPRQQVLPKALDLAMRIAEKPRVSLETLKKGLAERRLAMFEEAFTLEQNMHNITLKQQEVRQLIEDEYVE